jgi:RNA polymerase sigma-70 factor (ECF subfamily)
LLSLGEILPLERAEELNSLVPLARSGDPRARSDLFDAVLPRLQQFLIPKLGAKLQRHTDLDDLCQDVFLRGIKAIHSLDQGADYGQFVGLILQHAKWQTIDAARSQARFAGESNVPGGVMSIAADDDPENGEVLLFMREKVDWLHTLISRLPDDLAKVIWLRLDGLPDARISDLLSITPELVRKRHQRAIEQLRQFTS